MLDYACGKKTDFLCFLVGQVSRALGPYVAQLIGVDVSSRMVEVYNT